MRREPGERRGAAAGRGVRPSQVLISWSEVGGGDEEFGVMKANGSDRWAEGWHSSMERLAHSPAFRRDAWRENAKEKVNNRIRRGIIKQECSCYANTGM